MHSLLTVAGEADWEELRRRKLTTVLDPSILRTADQFFAGSPGWQGNAGALMTFADAVLLWDELPILLGGRDGTGSDLLTREPLADVFRPVRIVGEKRASSLLFVSYGERTVPGALKFPAAPTFLPLLLQEEDLLTPAHLAERLMVWRGTSAVRDYRACLARLRTRLAQDPAELAAVARRCGCGAGELAVEMTIEVVIEQKSLTKIKYRVKGDVLGVEQRLHRLWQNGRTTAQ